MPYTRLKDLVIRRFRQSPGVLGVVSALALGCATFVAFAPSAAAAPPCWKLLLNDWYDGTINKTYPIPCYHQAIAHLPTDVQVYSSARDDIERALAIAIAAKNHKPPPTTTTSTESQTSTSSGGGGTATTTTTTTAPTTTTNKTKSPISKAIKDITPGGADSFPLPLLILGLLAILLVIAGLGGLAWRRYQDRGGAST